MKRNKKKENHDDLKKMVSSKNLSWISVVIAIIVGRNEILSFVQSFSQGLTSFLNSLPSISILIILILLIVYLGKRK